MHTPTVMLVEDNTAVRTLQRVLLTRAGFTVVECADLAGSRQRLGTVCPAVVVLDVHLPDGYGVDLLPSLDRTRTQVLMMSAMDQRTGVSGALQADEFMLKPFKSDAFLSRVQSLVERAQALATRAG